MNKPVLFSAALLIGAIAYSPTSAKALCINEDGSFRLEREDALEDESFASTGPARSDSDFRFEVNLSDFNVSPNNSDDVEESTAAAVPDRADRLADDEAPADTVSFDAIEAAAANDASPQTDDFDAVGVSDLPVQSREEHLNEIAADFNQCQN